MKVEAENATAPNVIAPTFFPLTFQFEKMPTLSTLLSLKSTTLFLV